MECAYVGKSTKHFFYKSRQKTIRTEYVLSPKYIHFAQVRSPGFRILKLIPIQLEGLTFLLENQWRIQDF